MHFEQKSRLKWFSTVLTLQKRLTRKEKETRVEIAVGPEFHKSPIKRVNNSVQYLKC